jgi:hypothetical protein
METAVLKCCRFEKNDASILRPALRDYGGQVAHSVKIQRTAALQHRNTAIRAISEPSEPNKPNQLNKPNNPERENFLDNRLKKTKVC